MSLLRGIRHSARNLFLLARNRAVSLRRSGLDYVTLELTGSYPERRDVEPPLPFPLRRLVTLPREPSLEGLRWAAEVLAADRRVRGVVLCTEALAAGPATVQALCEVVRGLREAGKQVVCWLPQHADTWLMYLASACTHVLLPEGATVFAAGLRTETVFLKEALDFVGLQADLEAFQEYKSAPETFSRTTMSEAHREMLEAILDSLFDGVVEGIARGRGLSPDEVRGLMDRMPVTARDAVAAGLADHVRFEDEMTAALGGDGPSGSLCTWQEARRLLRWPVRWRRPATIGVVPVEGLIVSGRSRRLPPLPVPLPGMERQAGSESVVQALRQAERDARIVAVVLQVETSGGSALASERIWREVDRLRHRKPVVALLGNQATSGGYLVAVPASAIVAQPFTLTGSIGIWGGKLVTAGLLDRLRVGREVVQRGARAGFYSDAAPFSDEERQVVRGLIGESYALFKERVGAARGMTAQQVEEVARGRVWTGQQALERGLVDELGGFETALRRAKQLAGLDPDRWVPVTTVTAPRQEQLALAYPATEAGLLAIGETLCALVGEWILAMAPWQVRVQG
jgi:protease-4